MESMDDNFIVLDRFLSYVFDLQRSTRVVLFYQRSACLQDLEFTVPEVIFSVTLDAIHIFHLFLKIYCALAYLSGSKFELLQMNTVLPKLVDA